MIGVTGSWIFSLALAGLAQPLARPPDGQLLARAQAEKLVMLNFDALPLSKAVKWMSQKTGRNFIVEDSLKDRRITIVSGVKVTTEEAFEAFVSALKAEGMFTSEEGKFLRISSRPGARPPRAEARVAGLECPPLSGIEQIDDITWRIARTAAKEWLHSGACFTVQARIVPAFQDGLPNGFKLFSIRPGSIYTQIGIKNGDVIQKVNGTAINSPELALEMYAKLQDAKTIEVDILRLGQVRRHTYRME
jgi:general secretion pathway protein C